MKIPDLKKSITKYVSLKKSDNNIESIKKVLLKILKSPVIHIFIFLLLLKILRIIYKKINVYNKKKINKKINKKIDKKK
jgi:hypothetical protein